MEIYQLKVFLAVARCLNFTEAAESLNLTQPAVSAKIKSLELELKVSLFNRLGRQIQLTDVGLFLVKEAEKLVELEIQIGNKIENFKQQKQKQIALGSTSGLAQSWLPNIIYQYRKKYPEIDLKLEVFQESHLLEKALEHNQIDLGFSEIKLNNSSGIEQRNIDSLRYGLIVAANSLLARKNWQTLIDVKQKPLVLLKKGFASRQIFESRLAELNLKLTDFPNVETVDTINLMRTYIVKGDYIGFASNLELQTELESEILTSVTLQEFALSENIYVGITPKTDSCNSNSIQKFLALFPKKTTPKSIAFLNTKSDRQKTITINLGIQNTTIPTISAGLLVQRLRLLEKFLPRTGDYEGITYDIRWHNFLSGMPITEGLQSRQLNIGILGDYPLLQSAILQNNSTQLVSFVSINPNGDGNAVIVPQTSKLETIEDLQGHIVALPFGSSAHGMLLRSLSHLDLLSEVQLFPLQNSQLKTSFNQKIAAGYAYFSPFHQLASDRGQFKYLSNDNLDRLPGFYGVVVSQAFANKYPEIIVSYLQAILAAQNWLANTPSAISLVSKWTKIKPEILAEILTPNNLGCDSSLFINDLQIRSDWILEHINRLKNVPSLESLQTIELDRWIQPEFLEFAKQN